MNHRIRNLLAAVLVVLSTTCSRLPPTLAQESKSTADDEKLAIKIFEPQHVSAAEAVQVMEGLLLPAEIKGNFRITFNSRTNTIIVRAPATVHEQIETVFRHLDQPKPAAAAQKPNAPAAQKPDAADAEDEVKVFHLNKVSSAAAAKLINELYAEHFAAKSVTIGSEPRTNTLWVRGPASLLMTIEATLLHLDELDQLRGKGDSVQQPKDENALDMIPQRSGMEHALRARALAGSVEFQQYEQAAQAAAQAYRQQLAVTPRDEAKLAQLKSDVQGAVHSAFHARQSWQRKKVAEMRKRLDEIEKNVSDRSQRSNEIIQRRVEDLLNPERQWEAREEASPAVSADKGPAFLPNDLSNFPAGPEFSVARGRRAAARQQIQGDDGAASNPAAESKEDPRRDLVEAENAVALGRAVVEEAAIDAQAADATLERMADVHKKGGASDSILRETQVDTKRKGAVLSRARAALAGKERLLDLAKERLASHIQTLELELERAKANLDQAVVVEHRADELLRNKAISVQEYDRIVADSGKARLTLERAEKQYESYRKAFSGKDAGNKHESPGTSLPPRGVLVPDADSNPQRDLLDAENAVALAQATVEEAVIDAQAADVTLEKMTEVHKRGAVPDAKFRDAQVDAKRKAAALNRARADLKGKERVLQQAKQHLEELIKLSEADVQQTKSLLELRTKNEARVRALLQNKAISQEEFEKTQATSEQARFNYERAKWRYDLYRKALPGNRDDKKSKEE